MFKIVAFDMDGTIADTISMCTAMLCQSFPAQFCLFRMRKVFTKNGQTR